MCGNTRGFNCTNYVAYRLQKNGVKSFMNACGASVGSNAASWDERARGCAIRVDKKPAVGAVIQWDGYAPYPGGSGTYSDAGHVAYIDAVSDDGTKVYISEAACSLQQGHRTTLDWPISGLGSSAEVLHPGDVEAPDPAPVALRSDVWVVREGADNDRMLLGKKSADFTNLDSESYNIRHLDDVLITGDFNGDGKDDVWVTRNGEGDDHMLLATSGGQFRDLGDASYDIVTPDRATDPDDALLVGDFNGDGKDDVWVVRTGADNDRMLLATSGGQFRNLGEDSPDITYPTDVLLVGDFNGDKKSDVWIARNGSQDHMFLATSGGHFKDLGDDSYDIANPDLPSDPNDTLLTGDYNGDGKDDVWVVRTGDANDRMLLATSGGQFTNLGDDSPDITNPTDLLLVGDFNGDKKDDVWITRQGVGNDHMLLASSGGHFRDQGDDSYDIVNPGDLLLVGNFDGK